MVHLEFLITNIWDYWVCIVIVTSNMKSDMIKHTNLHQATIGIQDYYDKTENKGNRCQNNQYKLYNIYSYIT